MLEGIIIGVGPIVEGEASVLSTSAMTRVFSHPYLRDTSFDLGSLLESWTPSLNPPLPRL